MDREIPIEERKRQARKQWLTVGGIVAGVAAVVAIVMMSLGDSVKASDLKFGKAEIGPLESSVSASGKFVPLYEQIIVSPVATRVLEVYCNEGDTVQEGQSLLRLDLQTAESDLSRIRDEVAMKQNDIEQAQLGDRTSINNLEMQIKVKEMSVSHLKAEVANERRLDSIGSGTGDRIREAELAYSTGLMELEQLRLQLENEKKMRAASYRSKELEGSISQRKLQEMERTMEQAQVKAPRNGTVTWLSRTIGSTIGAGEKIAVVSDLSSFKAEGQIAESNAGKLSVGAPVYMRFNRNEVTGHISTISPQSENGMVSFIVFLDDNSSKLLRSGLHTDINVVYDSKPQVTRIPNGSYFKGAGEYSLFVRTGEGTLEKRSVQLGDSNFNYVEVESGLKPGDEVVISDLSRYAKKKSLKLK